MLRRQEDTIQRQIEELGRANQELDAFTRRVAHDLMGPLAPLKGYLTLIRRTGAVHDAGALEMLSQCESSAVRMGELIEALLRFCRAGTRGERTSAELDTAVSTVLLELAQTAAAQGVALERELEAGVHGGLPRPAAAGDCAQPGVQRGEVHGGAALAERVGAGERGGRRGGAAR